MNHPIALALALALAALLGCDDGPTTAQMPPPTPESDGGPPADAGAPAIGVRYQALSPTRRLLRASMALRGHRPSAEEFARVMDDPTAFDALIDDYLADPAFGAMVRQHFTEWMELDQTPDAYPAGFPPVGDLAGMATHDLNTSIIQAAGRLAEYIVMNDRPWTEVVTADYTLADWVVATVWGLPYDPDGPAWQVTTYTDGRPVAGVLSDGWVFTRMPSTENNRQRERASLIANALICHDYPGRPVRIPPDLDLTSEQAIANATEQNPACLSCHHTLDPLASFFAVHYGLRIPEFEFAYPLQQYTPEAAADYRPASYYGRPGNDLTDLGRMIAEDSRFAVCAVRRFYSELMHVPVEDVPQRAIARYLPVLMDNGMNVRALVRAITTSEAFAAVAAEGPGAPDVGLRRATPQQLDTAIEHLTGYRWWAQVDYELAGGPVGSVPLMRDYLFGYRTLAGGPNNFDTTTHLRTANPTTLLTLRGLAERAARHAIDAETVLSVPGALDGEDAAVSTQLTELELRFFGEPDGDIAPARALFDTALQASGDARRAWAITLAGLLQDPRMLYY